MICVNVCRLLTQVFPPSCRPFVPLTRRPFIPLVLLSRPFIRSSFLSVIPPTHISQSDSLWCAVPERCLISQWENFGPRGVRPGMPVNEHVFTSGGRGGRGCRGGRVEVDGTEGTEGKEGAGGKERGGQKEEETGKEGASPMDVVASIMRHVSRVGRRLLVRHRSSSAWSSTDTFPQLLLHEGGDGGGGGIGGAAGAAAYDAAGVRGAGGGNVGASASGAALSQMTFSQMPLPVTYKPGSRPWDGEPGCLVGASIMLKEEGRGGKWIGCSVAEYVPSDGRYIIQHESGVLAGTIKAMDLTNCTFRLRFEWEKWEEERLPAHVFFGAGVVTKMIRKAWGGDPQMLIDHKCAVLWQDGWYAGTITRFDASKGRKGQHLILYADGDERWYAMDQKDFQILDAVDQSGRPVFASPLAELSQAAVGAAGGEGGGGGTSSASPHGDVGGAGGRAEYGGEMSDGEGGASFGDDSMTEMTHVHMGERPRMLPVQSPLAIDVSEEIYTEGAADQEVEQEEEEEEEEEEGVFEALQTTIAALASPILVDGTNKKGGKGSRGGGGGGRSRGVGRHRALAAFGGRRLAARLDALTSTVHVAGLNVASWWSHHPSATGDGEGTSTKAAKAASNEVESLLIRWALPLSLVDPSWFAAADVDDLARETNSIHELLYDLRSAAVALVEAALPSLAVHGAPGALVRLLLDVVGEMPVPMSSSLLTQSPPSPSSVPFVQVPSSSSSASAALAASPSLPTPSSILFEALTGALLSETIRAKAHVRSSNLNGAHDDGGGGGGGGGDQISVPSLGLAYADHQHQYQDQREEEALMYDDAYGDEGGGGGFGEEDEGTRPLLRTNLLPYLHRDLISAEGVETGGATAQLAAQLCSSLVAHASSGHPGWRRSSVRPQVYGARRVTSCGVTGL